MRVITGLARGRKLKEPEGVAIRPTSDMVKESIFNIIQYDVEGRSVLDLFAGTGQLGIEALSRGAATVTFVDESASAIKLVKENLKRTELPGGKTVLGDALKFLEHPGKFDLIFIDPPYATGLMNKSLQKIFEFDKLNENGIIICESKKDLEMPEPLHPYKKLREYRYGKVKITVYMRLSRLSGSQSRTDE
ncbi:MAG TPA: 16S rRNA (guanine(966)-N(2))-methyltransferase RsmD [Clostridiales bacterium]|jgi:16S rRNA (guanine966-N2)-methyltransferase|nr:16S rRNA (guanine(966)-N(2))-methyltransferase RsmD [Clostridiales bacterium]